MYFEENLTKLLKREGLTIEQLAKNTGVPKSTLHNWMNGVSPADMRILGDKITV